MFVTDVTPCLLSKDRFHGAIDIGARHPHHHQHIFVRTIRIHDGEEGGMSQRGHLDEFLLHRGEERSNHLYGWARKRGKTFADREQRRNDHVLMNELQVCAKAIYRWPDRAVQTARKSAENGGAGVGSVGASLRGLDDVSRSEDGGGERLRLAEGILNARNILTTDVRVCVHAVVLWNVHITDGSQASPSVSTVFGRRRVLQILPWINKDRTNHSLGQVCLSVLLEISAQVWVSQLSMWRIPIEDVCQIYHLEGERAVIPISFKTMFIWPKSCLNSLWDKHSSRSVSSFWKFSFMRGLLLASWFYTSLSSRDQT